jgi:exonuclease SbcC
MIKELEIQNFQSWANSSFRFDPGVNVICGSSDSGKSAIMRALEWAVTNRPSGDAFRRWDTEETRVSIETDEGFSVSRIKGKTENRYMVTNNEHEELILKAFWQDVPDEVSETLNLCDLNFQHQQDSPFLLSENAGEVGRQLNKIANLDAIDTALSAIDKMARENKQKARTITSDIDDLKIQLADFDYLPKMEKALTEIEELEKKAKEATRLYGDILSCINEEERLQKKLEEFAGLVKARAEVNAVVSMISKQADLLRQIASIHSLCNEIRSVRSDLEDATKKAAAKGLVEELGELNVRHISSQKLWSALCMLLGTYEGLEEVRAADNATLQDLRTEWKEIAPDICPLCEGKGTLK